MSIPKKIALGLLGLLGLVLVIAALRPASFRVERSLLVNAPPDRVYPLLADFHRWTAWSPWEAMDPAMQRNYSGAPQGLGAAYAWQGNDKVGAGRMEIIETAPPPAGGSARGGLKIKLDFLKPIAASNTAEFKLDGGSDGTTITWAMTGPSPYVARLMGLFFSMDKLVGKDFEAGLAKLKAEVDK
ncbi:MAG: hypothetical protein RIQ60_890 [Pseudomonadota bacterium]|jgi:hypothetical protein